MTIRIAKKTLPPSSAKAAKPTTLTVEDQITALIDELGHEGGKAAKIADQIRALGVELKPYKDKLAHLGELLEGLQKDPDEAFVFNATEYYAAAGPCARERTVDLDKLRKKLGDKTFFAICKVSLVDLDRYVTKAEQVSGKIVIETRGARKVKIEPKGRL